MNIQIKAIGPCFRVVLVTILYKVVPTFECVDEILEYAHSNESPWKELHFGRVSFVIFHEEKLKYFLLFCTRRCVSERILCPTNEAANKWG